MFIFSTHKYPKDLSRYSDYEIGGELLVELKQEPIASAFYTFPGFESEIGYQLVTYSIYTRFDNVYIPKERVINRSLTNFYLPEKLEELINLNGFAVHSIDNNSHSSVYCLQKEH